MDPKAPRKITVHFLPETDKVPLVMAGMNAGYALSQGGEPPTVRVWANQQTIIIPFNQVDRIVMES